MKIGFVGCGAIGSCYASYLSREHEDLRAGYLCSGHRVHQEKRHSRRRVRARHGHRRDRRLPSAMATTDPKEIGVVDLLIVFVHYQYLEAAVRNALR